MKTEHTPEPWIYAMPDFDHEGIICGRHGGQVIDGEFNEANARRIVACVNTCAGISTENLEDNKPLIELAMAYNVALRQRDELLKALEFYADPIRYRGPNQLSDGTDKFTPNEMCYLIDVTRDCGNIAKTAIASVKEKA